MKVKLHYRADSLYSDCAVRHFLSAFKTDSLHLASIRRRRVKSHKEPSSLSY